MKIIFLARDVSKDTNFHKIFYEKSLSDLSYDISNWIFCWPGTL